MKYIHIGNNVMARSDRIIGVFDMDTATIAESTKNWLRNAQGEGTLTDITGGGLPKALVLTDGGARRSVYTQKCADKHTKLRVYMTRVNTATIRERAE